MNPLQAPFVPAKQAYPQEQVYPQATNPEKKNDNENNHIVTESRQDVDLLVDAALQLTWDMCFDGTQVIFKEPETLTVFKEELSLDHAEGSLVRAMRAGKFRNFPALKLRGPKSVEADRLFMKISPMDCRLKREQDTKILKKLIRYKHILHAPKGSSSLSVCIPSHPWPEYSQPLTCLHCNLTTDRVNIHQFQFPTINIPRPETSEVRILHNENLCPYHDYYLMTGRSLGCHELWALSVFQQWGISFGTERGRRPGPRQAKGLDRYFDEKRSHFKYFIDRMREEVVEKREHLVTTEADLKLGTFLGEGSVPGYVFEACEREGKAKRIGVFGDGRPVVKCKETGKEEDEGGYGGSWAGGWRRTFYWP